MIADADDFIDLPKKSQQAVCDVQFAAVSWCREIISQFSMVADTSIEIRGKLIARLEHMLEIEGELAAFAGILSDWVHPAMRFSLSFSISQCGTRGTQCVSLCICSNICVPVSVSLSIRPSWYVPLTVCLSGASVSAVSIEPCCRGEGCQEEEKGYWRKDDHTASK